jgi:hypothetical protein
LYPEVGREVVTHRSGAVWIEPDRVIHGILKPLLAAQIPFCGFDGNMSEKKLDLFELAASLMAQSLANRSRRLPPLRWTRSPSA